MKAILPKPPSTNHIYKFSSRGGFARSYISAKGVAWFEEAGILVKNQIKERGIADPVSVNIEYYTILGDCDGILKPSLDLLQKTGIIVNDSQVMKLSVEKFIVHHKPDQKLVLEINVLK